MSNQVTPHGLYLVKRPKKAGPGDHFAVLDVGNRAVPKPSPFMIEPCVIHQMPDGIKVEPIKAQEKWEVVEPIVDEQGAKRRIHEALKTPHYDLLGNNCEHFSRFIASGKKESKQVQFIGLAFGVAVFIYAKKNNII
jgi:hypothetical protein